MSARSIKRYTIEKISNGVGICTEEGTYFCVDKDVASQLMAGDVIDVETKNFSLVTGVRFDGIWLFRKTDEDLEREHKEYCEQLDKRRIETLEKNREDWQRRTDMLPGWLKGRIETFFEKGGKNFEKEGWGYELAVCELAALYEKSYNLNDSEEIEEYARINGTSGNRHAFAKALVRGLREGIPLAGTVSALSPITGDAFYEGKN